MGREHGGGAVKRKGSSSASGISCKLLGENWGASFHGAFRFRE